MTSLSGQAFLPLKFIEMLSWTIFSKDCHKRKSVRYEMCNKRENEKLSASFLIYIDVFPFIERKCISQELSELFPSSLSCHSELKVFK